MNIIVYYYLLYKGKFDTREIQNSILVLSFSYCFIFFFLPWVGCVGLGSLD